MGQDDAERDGEREMQNPFAKRQVPVLPVMQHIPEAEIKVRRQAQRQKNGPLPEIHGAPPEAGCSRDIASARLQWLLCSQSVASETTMKISNARCSLACRSDSSA